MNNIENKIAELKEKFNSLRDTTADYINQKIPSNTFRDTIEKVNEFRVKLIDLFAIRPYEYIFLFSAEIVSVQRKGMERNTQKSATIDVHSSY